MREYGFASILLLIAVLLVAGVGGAYYFGYDHGFEESVKEQKRTISPTPVSFSVANETANWKTYKGETIYTTDGSSIFTIKYPAEWKIEGNVIYPEGKGKDSGLTPRIVLGVGGHGAPSPTGEKIFPAGKATYWRIEENDGKLALVASFPEKDISYIFEGYNLTLGQEEVFLKMLETFEITN